MPTVSMEQKAAAGKAATGSARAELLRLARAKGEIDIGEDLEEDAATIFSNSTVESKVIGVPSNDVAIEDTANLAALPLEWSNGVCGCVADPLSNKIVSVYLLVLFFIRRSLYFCSSSNLLLFHHLFFRSTMASHVLFVQPAVTGTLANSALGT